MELNKLEIPIQLRTVIEENGDKEMNIIKQIGQYVGAKNREVITFSEDTELGEVRNFITLQDGKVTLKRSGQLTMNQKFILGERTESIYRHPYGTLHLEIHTKKMQYDRMEQGRKGKVIIQYDMIINGDQKRRHHLTLIYGGEKE